MQKRSLRSLLCVLSMVLSFACAGVAFAAADYTQVRSAYDEYLRSYNDFKVAADRNSDQDAIKKQAEKYKAALEKYQTLLADFNKSKTAEKKQEQQASTEGQQAAASVQSRASAFRTMDEAVKALRSAGARDKADQIIATLENVVKTSKNAEEVNRAKMELANVYAKYKYDYNKAVELLQQVVTTVKSGPAFEEANRAYVRARYCQEKARLASVIGDKRKVVLDAKKLSENTSWTSPLSKVKNLFNYYKNDFTYRKAIANFKSYQKNGEFDKTYVNYEFLTDMFGSRHVLGVEDTFDNTSIPIEDVTAQIRLITDNNEAWYARWWMLNEAKSTIDMTYFIFEKDAYGKAMLGLLYEKAKAGVKIRLMIDARGSKALAKTFLGQDYLQKLAQIPGVQIKVFNTMHQAIPSTIAQFDIRSLIASNHQKIIIIDGLYCITGGRNISLNYFADPRDNDTVFRDTDVLLKNAEISGQMKTAFEEEFVELNNFDIDRDLFGNWSHKEKELIAAKKSMEMWMTGKGVLNDPVLKEVNAELSTYKHMVNYVGYNPFARSHLASVKLYGKHNFQTERNDITENIINLMDACSTEIIVQNPYVILTEKSRAALKRASDRGVKIRIHTNSPVSTDSILTQAFFLKDWKEVLRDIPNARVFVFVGANKLHAKTFVFDKKVSCVGTYNMDYMSEQINSEDICAVKSADFAADMIERIEADIAISKEYKIKVNSDGSIEEIYGPGQFTSKKTMFILETLMKIKFLKPLI